jgi:hypothetical protein
MDGLEALVAIVIALVPIALRFLTRFYRLREKELMLRIQGEPARIEQLLDERRALEARVEALESIVCSAEFDFDQRLRGALAGGPRPALPALGRPPGRLASHPHRVHARTRPRHPARRTS